MKLLSQKFEQAQTLEEVIQAYKNAVQVVKPVYKVP
jgi:hypothetical protein